MPWPPNGDYYIFREESIKAKAPPVSGVYGLYNLKNYVLIGESADIRAALLHHEKETGFRFGLYRPIGFTFEVCPAESRAQRAQELITEYCPVLQRELFAFARSWRARKDRGVTTPESSRAAAKDDINHEVGPVFMVDERRGRGKRFYFSRDQLVVVALAFAVTAVSIAALGILTGKKIEATRIVKGGASLVKIPVDAPLEGLRSTPGVQTEEGLSSHSTLPTLPGAQPSSRELSEEGKRQGQAFKAEMTKPEFVVEQSATTTPQRASERGGERTASLPAIKEERQISQAAKQEEPGKTWTVQVRASPDKGVADDWADRLKAKGYNAFIVMADIKGQTWYRVRVGPFDTREEAETSRKTLESREGFSDAFLAIQN